MTASSVNRPFVSVCFSHHPPRDKCHHLNPKRFSLAVVNARGLPRRDPWAKFRTE